MRIRGAFLVLIRDHGRRKQSSADVENIRKKRNFFVIIPRSVSRDILLHSEKTREKKREDY